MQSHMNSYGLFVLSYIAYSIAFLSYLLISTGKIKIPRNVNIGILLIGITAHTFGLLSRWKEAGHAPFANMYESLVFMAWVVAFAYTMVEIYKPMQGLGVLVIPISWLVMGYALNIVPVNYIFGVLNTITAGIAGKGGWFPPPTREAEALMPALNSYWLEIHVVTIFLAYGAFALSFGSGILYLWKSRNLNTQVAMVGDSKNSKLKVIAGGSGTTEAGLNLDNLDNYTYWVIAFGFIMLGAGIVFGAVWANETWGSYWSWDPKETWSLITWLVYAVFLHTRLVAQWRGPKTAWLAVLGFVAVIICYYGVNIIMPRFVDAGLHSYGSPTE